ncbi:MAG TPA: autotransporter domain-containing protein [Sphingobium sp.]
MVSSNKAKLSTGVASMAVVFTLAQPAEAACTSSAPTVTCDSAGNTVTDVNAAVSSITPPNVSLVLSAGSTVVDDSSGPLSIGAAYNGAVSFTNSGTVGTDLANVDFRHNGDGTTATSSFIGVNNADSFINGDYDVDGVGTASLNNAGHITGNVDIRADLFNSSTNDGVTTFSYGGTATVTNTGVIGTLASPADLDVVGYGGATLVNSGTAGSLYVRGGAFNGNYTSALPPVVDGTKTTTTYFENYTVNDASVSATVSGSGADLEVYNYGTGSTTVAIDGAVGSSAATGSVYISNAGYDSQYKTVSIVDSGVPAFSDYTYDYAYQYRGGPIAANVGATGQVFGDFYAESYGGPVTVNVVGKVGSDTIVGDVTARASVTNYVEHYTDVDTDVNNSLRTRSVKQMGAGGLASVTVAPGAVVSGDVSAYGGLGGASVTISGQVGTDSSTGFVTSSASGIDYELEYIRSIVSDGVDYSETSTETAITKRLEADASLTMTGGSITSDAEVSATRDAIATIDAASTIGGDLNVFTDGSTNENLDPSDNYVITIVGGDTTTVTTNSDSNIPISGNATANIAGIVAGDVEVASTGGDAKISLTGQAKQGAYAKAASRTSTQTTVDTLSPTVDGFVSNFSSVASGGTATVDIQSSDTMKAAKTPAVVEGQIKAEGFTAATVSIGAGSRVFTDPTLSIGGGIIIDSVFEDETSSLVRDEIGTGSEHRTLNTTATGGTATFTNAGTVGFATESILTGYYDAPIEVDLESATAANFANSGTLYGDVYVKSLGGTYSSVSDYTGYGVGAVQTARTQVWTKGGGTLAFTNSGLIGGDLDLTSETATVTNTGVIRGVVELGSSQQNYTVEGPDSGTPTIVALGGPFTQTYTVNQKGFVAGASDTLFDDLNGPTAIAITGAIEDNSPSFAVDPSIAPASGPFISNNIVATVNLDAGSVTIGNIVAEHDADTGDRYTKSALNLNGNGYLGLSGVDDFRLKETIGTLAAFSAKDPLLTSANLGEAATAVGAFTLGSRVLGLDTVTKTGSGVFVINGATYIDAAPTPAWTMDVGTFAIKGGEAQLDVSPFTYDAIADEFTPAATPEFAIRGNVVNDASLVIGRRLPGDSANPLSSSVVDGIEVYIKGNLTQSATGTLVMGAATETVGTGSVTSTSFVTSQALPAGTVTSQAVASTAFSTQALGQILPVSYGTTVYSSPSHITVDGDLNLAGKIDIATGPTAIYISGTRTDLFDVSGAVNINVETLTNGVNSPFLDFTYDTRPAGDGTTVVGVQVNRNSYATQAADLNVVHMGTVLDGLLPRIVQQLTDGAFSSAQDRANVEDFATVLAMLDTQLNEDEIADAMQELTSGEFYGSLAATRTTDPFGDFTRNLPRNTGEKALNLWINPAGSFLRQGRYSVYGASATRTNNYGGSIGFGGTSASGFSYGIGFGYGDIDQDARGTPEHAKANTYMVGAFAQVPLSEINLGVQAVYGWSNWKTSRGMPTFGRTAVAKFDSEEFRLIAEASHIFELGKVDIVPFLRGDLRHYSFDGFTESGGGAIGLIVDKKSKTLFSPEVGTKIVGNYGSGNTKIHPEASVSYTLQGDVGGNRDVAFLVDPASKFRLQGSDPDAFWTFGAGLSAQIGGTSSAYLRGAFASGGDQHGASFSAGVKIGF